MALKNIAFVVSGTVQGVGFRHFVKTVAIADGLVGWVRNDTVGLSIEVLRRLGLTCSARYQEGTVSGMAQGEEASLERMCVLFYFVDPVRTGTVCSHSYSIQLLCSCSKNLLGKGPRHSVVNSVEYSNEVSIERRQYQSFDIVRK